MNSHYCECYFPKSFFPQYYQMMNQPMYQNSYYLSHQDDLFCFQKCLQLQNTFISLLNNRCVEQNNLYGTLNSTDNALNLNISNILSRLPLNIREYQKFVLEPHQPKMNLHFAFNISNEQKTIKYVKKNFETLTFCNNIIAGVHNYNVFNAPIIFQVKGFEIVKGIFNELNKLNCKGIKKNNNNILTANIFRSILCNFDVDFSITYADLNALKELLKSYNLFMQNYHQYNITISKIKITYPIPLCIFNNRQMYNIIYIPIIPHMVDKNKINSKNNRNNLFSKYGPNFSNWNSFLKSTTPIIYQTDELLIKEFFNAFIKPSLFGVQCLFKVNDTHYTKILYFPSISKIKIHIKQKDSEGDSTSSDSELSKDDEIILKEKNTISFEEKEINEFNIPSYQSKIKELYKNITNLQI